MHQLRRIGMRLPGVPLAIEAADRQVHHRLVERCVVAILRVDVQGGIALARDLGRHAREEIVHQRAGKPDRLEIIAAAIGGDHRDPHLRHDLQQPFLDCLAVPLQAFVERQVAEQPARLAIHNRRFGEVSVHRRRAHADQHSVIMRVEALGRAHVHRGVGAQASPHEMRVHRRRREHAWNRDPLRPDIFVGQEDLALALAHRLFGLVADALDRGAQLVRPTACLERAVDFRRRTAEIGLQPCPVGGGQHRRIEHQHALAPILGVEDVGEVPEPRLEAHHIALAQRVDRRVRHLAEILPEELADEPRLVRDDGQRRIVAHRSDRFLGGLHHWREDQLHILQRLPGRHLATRQLGAVEARHAGGGRRWQIVDGREIADHPGIVRLGCDPVLDGAIVVDLALGQIDRDHLPRPQPALGDDGRFRHHYHAAFGTDDQQAVRRLGIAQRAERVAVHARHGPAAVGHRQRGRAVPRLHHRGEILVHRRMRRRHVVGDVALPRFGHQHQLGGRRIASRTADRLEGRVERRGIRRARRNHRLDVLRMLAERDARHADLVAEHPVLVAADRVDLAVMRQAPERLREPPLRKGVGGITLVKDRDAALEALVGQVRVEDRQALGQEQPLVDDRAAAERTDVEALDLRRDHALLDPPAHEIQVLFEFGRMDLVRHRPGDHDLLDLGTGRLRLHADHRHVDGHLTPAIDGIARLDDRTFHDRAARLLRGQIGARQEHHAHRQPVRPHLVPAHRDRIVEEAYRQVDMQPRAIARLAVRIHRAAMPHRLQRIDRRLNDTARRLAIGRRHQAHAAGITLELGTVHAMGGEIFALVGHHFSSFDAARMSLVSSATSVRMVLIVRLIMLVCQARTSGSLISVGMASR